MTHSRLRVPKAFFGSLVLLAAASVLMHLAFPAEKPAMPAASEPPAVPDEAFAQRIAEIANHPGFEPKYGISLAEEGFLIPVFGFTRDDRRINAAQFLELRARRVDAIAILKRDLERATSQTLTTQGESFAYGSRLLMLLDLNGSEALEDLILAAGRLSPGKAEVSYPYFEGGRSRRAQNVVNGKHPGLATLSAILALLYYERDPAVLKSVYMDGWRKALNEEGSKSEAEFKALPADKQPFWFYDPWEKRAAGFPQYFLFPWTPNREQEIFAMARNFVKRVPVDQRARAKNMAPVPYPR